MRRIGEIEDVRVTNSRNTARDEFERSKATVTMTIRTRADRLVKRKAVGFGRTAEEANDNALYELINEIDYHGHLSRMR